MEPHLPLTSPPVGTPLPNWQPPPTPPRAALDGRYCRLDPLQAELHAADLFAANSLDAAGQNWTYLPYGPFASLPEYRDWMARQSSGEDPLFFAVVDRSRGQATGVASYLRIQPTVGSLEIGHLHFSPLLQRTAAATEALYLLIRQAFELGYRRCEWKCDSLNAPSRAAALRLGFTFEGISRQATVVKGRNRDTAWYSMIDGEWPSLCAGFEQWLAPGNFQPDGQQCNSLASLTAELRSSR